MVIAKIEISGTTATVIWSKEIPMGLVGGRVQIEYTDERWNTLNKTVVFRGAVTKDVLDDGNDIVIPAEVLSRSGINFYVGVYGTDAENNIGIPTFWAKVGIIRDATDPNLDPNSNPDLPVWARLLERTPDWLAQPGSDNYILNRTHWSSIEKADRTFDGNLEGRTYHSIANGYTFVKITDRVLTKADLIGSAVVLRTFSAPDEDATIIITESMIQDGASEGYPALLVGEFVVSAYADFDIYGLHIEKGVYFLHYTADLLPADYNPRKDLKPGDAEYEKLKRSIEQFGYVEPVIWNRLTGRGVGGHQRLKVLMDMGMSEVDCVVVELPEEKEKALNIALNKISGEWDKDKLALLITDLQGADFDVSLTGFDPAEIDDLFKDSLKDGVQDDGFDIEAELKQPTITKPGDIWTLGRHRLICGDSTDADTFDLLMGKTKANLVITDPPYNVNYEGSAGKIKNDNMADEAFYTFLLAAFQNTESAMASDASIYVFHADTEGLNFRRAFADAGFYLSGCCIWKKQSLVLGRSP